MTVTGHETVRVPATRARLTAMIETQAESPAAAQGTVRQRSQSVLDFLQRSKVDRLQAGAMTLYPVYGELRSQSAHAPDQPAEVIAYRAQWSASFEVEAGRAGEIADGLVGAGAARIASFDFTATEDELAQAQQEALRGAARRARADARAVLDALGYQPGDVIRIEVHSGGPVRPFAHRAEMMSALSAGPAPSTAVEPGLVEVNGSVTLEVGY